MVVATTAAITTTTTTMPPAMAPIRSEADPWETVVEVVAPEVLAMDEVAEVGAEIVGGLAFEAVLKVAVARELGGEVEKSAVHRIVVQCIQ